MPLGHLTPSNICSHINKQLNQEAGTKSGYQLLNKFIVGGNHTKLEFPYSYTGNNSGIIQDYNCYKSFQCATYGTFCIGTFNHAQQNQDNIKNGIEFVDDVITKYYYESFHSIAVYDPELMIKGRTLMLDDILTIKSFKIKNQIVQNGKNLIVTDIDFNNDNTTKWNNLSIAYRNNDLFNTPENSDVMILHVQSATNKTNHPDRLGDDNDPTLMSIVQKLKYNNNNINDYNPVAGSEYNYGFLFAVKDSFGNLKIAWC